MTSLLIKYCDNCGDALETEEDIYDIPKVGILCMICYFDVRACKHDWEAWLSNTSQCVKCGARRDNMK